MREVFISIDVETAGPIPGEYSLLAIGACLAGSPKVTFECELQPINDNFDPKALEVSGLSLELLKQRGLPPVLAMEKFRSWISEAVGADAVPVFVGFNAPFDWSFVNYYFHRYLGENPFGFTALDIKALYMGKTGSSWHDTRSSQIAKHVNPKSAGDHDALHDALFQAELLRLIIALP